MKIYKIFKKNLKTISRDRTYFLMLMLFPLILIMVAGFMVNSVSSDNLKISYYDEGGEYSDMISSQNGFGRFMSEDMCIDSVSSLRNSACLVFKKNEFGGSDQLTVYFDGTNAFIEPLVKQVVLGLVSDIQGAVIRETQDKISENIESYKVLFYNTESKLVETRDSLKVERINLVQSKSDAEALREDFLRVYSPIKESQNEFYAFKYNFERNGKLMDNKVDDLRSQTDSMKSTIIALRSTGVSYELIDEVEVYVYSVSAMLDLYESTYNYDGMVEILNNMATMYEELDNINYVLTKTVSDLDSAINRIDENIDDIEDYLRELSNKRNSLDKFNEETTDEGFSWNFKSVFNYKDPVILAFPLLVSIIIVFTSLVLSNMITSKQNHEGSFFREMVSPIKSRNFLFANYFVNLFFVMIQAVVLFILGFVFIGIPFSSIGAFFLGIFLVASIFILIGMSLSYFVKSQAVSSLIAIFIVMFSFMVSDVIANSAMVSGLGKFLISINPFSILMNYLNMTLVIGESISRSSGSMIVLIVILLGCIYLVGRAKSKHDKSSE